MKSTVYHHRVDMSDPMHPPPKFQPSPLYRRPSGDRIDLKSAHFYGDISYVQSLPGALKCVQLVRQSDTDRHTVIQLLNILIILFVLLGPQLKYHGVLWALFVANVAIIVTTTLLICYVVHVVEVVHVIPWHFIVCFCPHFAHRSGNVLLLHHRRVPHCGRRRARLDVPHLRRRVHVAGGRREYTNICHSRSCSASAARWPTRCTRCFH